MVHQSQTDVDTLERSQCKLAAVTRESGDWLQGGRRVLTPLALAGWGEVAADKYLGEGDGEVNISGWGSHCRQDQPWGREQPLEGRGYYEPVMHRQFGKLSHDNIHHLNSHHHPLLPRPWPPSDVPVFSFVPLVCTEHTSLCSFPKYVKSHHCGAQNPSRPPTSPLEENKALVMATFAPSLS